MSGTLTKTPPRGMEGDSEMIAKHGLKSTYDVASYLLALAAEVRLQKVSCRVANASCNAIGKFLKMAEIGIQRGQLLSSDDEEDSVTEASDPKAARRRELVDELVSLG